MTGPGEKVAYFAYGSNMASATFRVRRSIEWTRAMPARAAGWRLVVRKPSLLGGAAGAMATILSDESSEVWGVLYEISLTDLEHLELTEGVRIGHYSRTEIIVEPAGAWNGDTSRVAAVTLTSDAIEADMRPTPRYMELLLSGAAEHGLPESWIDVLRAIETAPESADTTELHAILDHLMKKPPQ